MTTMELNVKEAAISFAKAWNNLDCTDFIKLLDKDAHYASQWVLDELKSKDAISDYLAGKMETTRQSRLKVFAELGYTNSLWAHCGNPECACVILAQGDKEDIQSIAIFEVKNNKIQRYDLCMPELVYTRRTGIYPS